MVEVEREREQLGTLCSWARQDQEYSNNKGINKGKQGLEGAMTTVQRQKRREAKKARAEQSRTEKRKRQKER